MALTWILHLKFKIQETRMASFTTLTKYLLISIGFSSFIDFSILSPANAMQLELPDLSAHFTSAVHSLAFTPSGDCLMSNFISSDLHDIILNK